MLTLLIGAIKLDSFHLPERNMAYSKNTSTKPIGRLALFIVDADGNEIEYPAITGLFDDNELQMQLVDASKQQTKFAVQMIGRVVLDKPKTTPTKIAFATVKPKAKAKRKPKAKSA
jgi:hypothetical protein